jgi:hypothetical protein
MKTMKYCLHALLLHIERLLASKSLDKVILEDQNLSGFKSGSVPGIQIRIRPKRSGSDRDRIGKTACQEAVASFSDQNTVQCTSTSTVQHFPCT